MYKLEYRVGIEIVYVIIEDQNKIGLVTIITGKEPPPIGGDVVTPTRQMLPLPKDSFADQLKKIGVRGAIGYGIKKAIEEAPGVGGGHLQAKQLNR